MKVKILRAGVYLNEELKSQGCRAGTVLETREAYGHSLIDDGLAKEVAEEAPKATKKAVKKKEPAVKKTGGPGNPFLP